MTADRYDHIRRLQARLDAIREEVWASMDPGGLGSAMPDVSEVDHLAPQNTPVPPQDPDEQFDQVFEDRGGDAIATRLGSLLEVDTARALPTTDVERFQTLFGGGWESISERARATLVQAERLRRDLEDMYHGDPNEDFAIAVLAYSRALEIELHARLFNPFQNDHEHAFAMAATGTPNLDLSISRLTEMLAGGRPLAMGEMAHCIRNVGCRLSGECGNSYARFLADHVVDREAFCASFPKQLQKYVQAYRNPAAHIEQLSHAECVKARAFLLEEPIRLLTGLIEVTNRPPGGANPSAPR